MKSSLLWVAILALSASTASYAAPISSASDPALTGATVLDFESGPVGHFTSQAFGGVTISVANSAYASPASFDVAGDYAGSYNTRGRYHITNFGVEFQSMRFDFGTTTSALGFLFGASDSSWTLSAYNASNTLLDSINIAPVSGSNAGDFFGLSGLAGASYATLIQNQDGAYSNGGVDYVFVDNFAYAAGGQSVPEPTTLALFGLACLVSTRLRRKC
jgi:hypothetical protein